MDLRFISTGLRRLDEASSEVLVICLGERARPPLGTAGSVDFRMRGRLSELLERQICTGTLGELVLIPGRPTLPFDKILLFGIGDEQDFNERVYRSVVTAILVALERLRARTAVVELPGRGEGLIAPDQAVDILLELSGNRPEHDLWTLIESSEAERLISQNMVKERRRVRR